MIPFDWRASLPQRLHSFSTKDLTEDQQKAVTASLEKWLGSKLVNWRLEPFWDVYQPIDACTTFSDIMIKTIGNTYFCCWGLILCGSQCLNDCDDADIQQISAHTSLPPRCGEAWGRDLRELDQALGKAGLFAEAFDDHEGGGIVQDLTFLSVDMDVFFFFVRLVCWCYMKLHDVQYMFAWCSIVGTPSFKSY